MNYAVTTALYAGAFSYSNYTVTAAPMPLTLRYWPNHTAYYEPNVWPLPGAGRRRNHTPFYRAIVRLKAPAVRKVYGESRGRRQPWPPRTAPKQQHHRSVRR